MEIPFDEILTEMMRYNAGDAKRIQHALKVYAFASLIGEREGLDAETLAILKTAAALHDIGIHNCERKYGSAAGNYQELEGPPAARELLAPFGLPGGFTERVCFLISRHHTYAGVDGLDYQILLESDFLVNAYEDGLAAETAREAGLKFFRTAAGIELLQLLY